MRRSRRAFSLHVATFPSVMKIREDIEGHVREVNRCNQRGGRMLSIVDLLAAGTLERPLAAYLLARISEGASFLVGACPGGAGKTTVMCALLGCIPPARELIPAATVDVVRRLLNASGKRVCAICHEVGSGPYFAYLSGEGARLYFQLTRHEHQIATNLHADTLQECRHQLCYENGVDFEDFTRVELHIFLQVSGRWGEVRRRVATVWDSFGRDDHRLVYDIGRSSPWVGMDPRDPKLAPYQYILDQLAGGKPDIRSVRTRIVELLGSAESKT